jgi:hypothetical protein
MDGPGITWCLDRFHLGDEVFHGQVIGFQAAITEDGIVATFSLLQDLTITLKDGTRLCQDGLHEVGVLDQLA